MRAERLLERYDPCSEMSRDDHIDIFFSEEDGGYIADVPDLASCSAFGETAEEALRQVERARDAWLAAAREAGKPIPPPRDRPAIDQIAH
jgi:predicted RNase H-like HicB family nuclease